jgi:hypothetical protein
VTAGTTPSQPHVGAVPPRAPHRDDSPISSIIAVRETRRSFGLATACLPGSPSNLPFPFSRLALAPVRSSRRVPRSRRPPSTPHRLSLSPRIAAAFPPGARADRAAARRPAVGRWPRGGDRPSAPPSPAEPRLPPSDHSAPGGQASRQGRTALSPADETWCVSAWARCFCMFVCFLDATLMGRSPGLSACVERIRFCLGLGAELLSGFGTCVRGK